MSPCFRSCGTALVPGGPEGGMAATKVKLTKRAVDASEAPQAGERVVWDTEDRGFALRLYAPTAKSPSGRKVYVVRYRRGAGASWFTIGEHGAPWTPDAARERARDVLVAVAAGRDPAAAKREARVAMSVAALIDLYLSDGPATKPSKRASTWANDGSNLNRHVRPLMGRKLASEVTQAEAARAVRDIAVGKTAAVVKTGVRGLARVTGGEGVARRTRTAAAALWAWGLEHGHIKGANPFAAVKLGAAPERERFLSREEAGAFLDAVGSREAAGLLSGTFADALRLLLLTGARKTEVLGLRWAEVDFGRKLATLPPERTKAGGKTGARRIHLSAPAMSILARRRLTCEALEVSERSPYVFPGARGEGHATGLRRAFLPVCKAAGLEGVRLHDLRHSFASFALADGASLFLIGKALGHANARTTERYAHLSGDPLADLAAAVGARLTAEPGEAAAVIPMRRA